MGNLQDLAEARYVEDQRRYLGVLRSEAERLGRLVENVLSYARLERGRSAASLELCRLEVGEGACFELRLAAAEGR